MGAKPSTANGAQSPRSRAFSTSSSSEVVTAPGIRFVRSLGMDAASDRQRARSLSSVPDLHSAAGGGGGAVGEGVAVPAASGAGPFDSPPGGPDSPDADGSPAEELPMMGAGLALGRVYAAHSLPAHIWSLNAWQMNSHYSQAVEILSGKFVIKEMGINDMKSREITSKYYRVGNYHSLSSKDAWTACWLTMNLHSLKFEDSATDEAQESVLEEIRRLGESTGEELIAYKGESVEKNLLQVAGYTHLSYNIEGIGCPTSLFKSNRDFMSEWVETNVTDISRGMEKHYIAEFVRQCK